MPLPGEIIGETMTQKGEMILSRVAVTLSGLCLAGLATGLTQWGAWGAELDGVQDEQLQVRSDLRSIRKDIRQLEKGQAIAETILRGLAEKQGVTVPDETN